VSPAATYTPTVISDLKDFRKSNDKVLRYGHGYQLPIAVVSVLMSVPMSIAIFSVAQIVKLLQSPRVLVENVVRFGLRRTKYGFFRHAFDGKLPPRSLVQFPAHRIDRATRFVTVCHSRRCI